MPGEVLALVGESGSGKTTLIRAIQGLTHPTSGKVLFEGKEADARHLPDVQMVFQDPTGALNPRRTVSEIVAEGLRIEKFKGNEAEAVSTALSRAGLRPRNDSCVVSHTRSPEVNASASSSPAPWSQNPDSSWPMSP